MSLRLFVLKENPLIRYRLCASISESPDMIVVGEGAWTVETLDRLKAEQPDVLIFELFDASKVPDQIATLRDACPANRTKLFAIARADHLPEPLVAIDCGVEGLLKSGCTVEEIRMAIIKLSRDGTYLDPETALQIIGSLDSTETRRQQALALQLTDLEQQVIKDLSNGHSNLQISDRLDINERAVKGCIAGLKKKLGVTKRLDIVLSAKRLSLDCVVALKGWVAWLLSICQETPAIAFL